MTSLISQSATVPMDQSGSRFDQVAADLFPDFSRSRLQSWIKSGNLTINGRVVKPNIKVCGGESLVLEAELEVEGEWQAQDIALDIVHEDDSLIVINKPVGLVVHPAAGNWEGTLLNGLLFHYPELQNIPRAGIVHRLDKDTSGLMVVARTLEAQNNLVQQLQSRTVSRLYHAITHGECDNEGLVDAPIARHPSIRTKMAVVDSGKEARTHYRCLERFDGHAYIELKLETGRTHQIRVHMAHLGYPLVGDDQYGKSYPKAILQQKPQFRIPAEFPRQALHAKCLGLVHPKTGEFQQWQSELPEDFQKLLDHLRAEVS